MSNAKNTKIKIYIGPILIIALLTAFDQLTKAIITGQFAVSESVDVIKNVFTITYIQNRGIAWGMLEGKKFLFIIITVLILGLCFYIYQNIASNPKYKLFRICMLILISGAIGNMIDRIKLGYVIDFFSFDLINFPVFNVADIYVVCSMFVIFFIILFKFNDEDLSIILKKQSNKAFDDTDNHVDAQISPLKAKDIEDIKAETENALDEANSKDNIDE